ncbi:MAG TPA: hypothetical protein VLF59_05375 [Candidatus Saccharimonadales bacterium]|nr:hypothetical protein [Candidatus Saccharimonadales bacterium]
MSLSWDGTGHAYVNCSAGTLGAAGTGDYTMVVLMRPTDTSNGGPLSLWSGSVTGTEVRQIMGDTGKWFGENDFSSGFGGWTTNTWYMLGQSKVAGTNDYRWHLWAYASDGSGTKTHTTGTSAAGDGSAIAAVRLGDTNLRYNYGEVAVAAVWKRVLSDADFVSLCTNTASSFMSLGTGAPDALWLCNVASPASIVDATGNGANAASVSGSAVTGSGVDPPSYSYTLSSPSAIPAPWLKF